MRDKIEDVNKVRERDRARETERKKERREKRKRSKSPSPRRENSPPAKAASGNLVKEGCEVGDEFISRKDFKLFVERNDAQFERLEALLVKQKGDEQARSPITSAPGVASTSQSQHQSSRDTVAEQGSRQLEPGTSRPEGRQSPPPLIHPHALSDYGDSDHEMDEQDDFQSLNNAMFSAPNMSMDTAILDGISSFFTENEERGDDVSEKVASAISKALEGNNMKKEDLEKILEKYLVPKNITNLRVPKVKEEVWDFLQTNTKQRDLRDREAINMVVKSMAITSKLLDITFLAQSKNENIKPSDIFDALADQAKIEACTFHELNDQRKNKIRPFFRSQFKKLCKTKNKTNEFLFGESLAEEVKAIKETASVIDNIQGVVSRPGNAHRRGQFPQHPSATTHHNKRGSKPAWKVTQPQQKKGMPNYPTQKRGSFPKHKRKFHQ